MTPNRILRNLAALAFCAALCLSARAATDPVRCALDLSDRMLDVRLDVPAGGPDAAVFAVSDWAGQNNYADNIYRIAARDARGRPLTVERTDARRWTVRGAGRAFTLTYTVVSQKENFMGAGARSHFHPTLFRDYAFLWGAAFLLSPEDPKLAARPVELRFDGHEYGRVYSNLGTRAASFDDLGELFIAAGNYRAVEKIIGGRRVTFLLNGTNWKFTDDEFTKTVARIIEAQISYLRFSPSTDDLLITLTEGTASSKGGTVVKNVISVYPDPQAGLADFDTLKLISHEHFHFWNGNYWRDAGDKKEGYYKWMSEGFTEYYAGLTLYRENLITGKQFAAWLNELLYEYQTNPRATTATAEILAEKYWESQDYTRLPYVKGALFAFLADLKIRQNADGRRQIDDLMRRLIADTDRAKGYDDALLAGGLAALGGTDRKFYDDFALGAAFLPLAETLRAAGIACAPAAREVFDLGFATESGRIDRGARIREVTTDAARAAGLRPGDELRGFSFRFNRPQSEAAFTVARGGETVQIKYFPKTTRDLLQIDENARLPR